LKLQKEQQYIKNRHASEAYPEIRIRGQKEEILFQEIINDSEISKYNQFKKKSILTSNPTKRILSAARGNSRPTSNSTTSAERVMKVNAAAGTSPPRYPAPPRLMEPLKPEIIDEYFKNISGTLK